MKFNPNPPTPLAPLDRFAISTAIPLEPQLVSDTAGFRLRTGVPIRRIQPSKSYAKNKEYPAANVFISDYKGLRLFIDHRGYEPWTLRKIEGNFATLFHGANGLILTANELLLGLSLLIELLTPLLANEVDFVHLVPALTSDSRAFFSLVEIPFQISDPDGRYQHAFLNPRHPEIKKAAIRCDGESVHLGAPNAEMSIDFYRKDIEMKKVLGKYEAPTPPEILRIEITLTGKPLLKYLGQPGCTRVLRDKPRLVNINSPNLIDGHRAVVTRLKGCCQSALDDDEAPRDCIPGRLMAHVSDRTSLPITDQISICKERFNLSPNTLYRYRIAALDEYARLSSLNIEDVFALENYLRQPGIAIPELERMSHERREYTSIHHLVAAAYGPKAGTNL